MTAQVNIVAFPATRHQEFLALSGRVMQMVERQVREMERRLMTIAISEYGKGLSTGMPKDIAMERADNLLVALIDAAECERQKLLAEIYFVPSPNS